MYSQSNYYYERLICFTLVQEVLWRVAVFFLLWFYKPLYDEKLCLPLNLACPFNYITLIIYLHAVLWYRLNILAELLCFGDREFYKDWWNAKTVEEVNTILFYCFSSNSLYQNINHGWLILDDPTMYWWDDVAAFVSIGECGIWWVFELFGAYL